MAVAGFRWRSWWCIALLGLAPLLVSCSSSPPANVPQPLHIAQESNGPRPGMQVVGSPHLVLISVAHGSCGRPFKCPSSLYQVTFTLLLTNKGTVPYNCSVLRAVEIPQGLDVTSENGTTANAEHCTGDGHPIAPGAEESFSFFLSNFGHPPKNLVVLPYGSNVGRMVWSVADCPTFPPKTCYGPPQSLSP
jgi:hypothetical protein